MTARDPDPTETLSFSALVFSDFERHRPGGPPPTWRQVIPRCFSLTGILASIIVRAQQCLYRAGHIRSAWFLRTLGIILLGADFVPGMRIGTGLYLPHPVGIVIGSGARIGSNVMLGQGVTIGVRYADPTLEQEFPTICDSATIMARTTIVGGVRVGEGAQVGANSFVGSDVDDYTVVAGVPARRIGEVQRELVPAT